MYTYGTGPQRSVHVLHNSENPASVFALLEAASGNKTVALVTDSLFDLLMIKLGTYYQPRKQTKMESKGPRFEAGDFLVKLGSVTMGATFKGILVEVQHILIPKKNYYGCHRRIIICITTSTRLRTA